MKLVIEKSKLGGQVLIPASKSHTIRAVAIASLAHGTSFLRNPLSSSDTLAAVDVYRRLGADITTGNEWIVKGTGAKLNIPDDILNVANSGTTLHISMGTAALIDGYSVFTGDSQIRSRPSGPLVDALNQLGAQAFSTRGNGCPPVVIRGRMQGGKVNLDGSKSSQYLTSLLINCPLVSSDTEIFVSNAVETPYIEMTLGWLDEQGIRYEREGFERFRIQGGQEYRAFEKGIPGDFSSAAFFLCAAAITSSELTLLGLDINDSQGDKAVLDMLSKMGAEVQVVQEGICIRGGDLQGKEFDLNATPDLLPAMAVTACFAHGTTRLVNVSQARHKETDRIRVMCEELSKMGAEIKELPDGLEIVGRPLHGAVVNGHSDHRVVMALAVAGLAAEGETEVDTAEAVSVTFPNFVELMRAVGANIIKKA
ncbi:MAG: 3-phosphoshikimate 1-carboxyvinyltransferase [Armatimonadota bacterium]|nr:3-phosphoshikimate 1-carboxyvinyltransferase [Armatimonadota bacterium]